ncbi:ATP-binding protein, partial [Novosphingobium sp. 1949]
GGLPAGPAASRPGAPGGFGGSTNGGTPGGGTASGTTTPGSTGTSTGTGSGSTLPTGQGGLATSPSSVSNTTGANGPQQTPSSNWPGNGMGVSPVDSAPHSTLLNQGANRALVIPRTGDLTVKAPTAVSDGAQTLARTAARAAPARTTEASASAAPQVTQSGAPYAHQSVEPVASRIVELTSEPQPIPFRREHISLFDMASPPFIEGDFVAAARQPDGQWLAVAPREEPFPNAWQQRVMLWFALSLAIISPLAWLFARRIVVPLRDFARAAEQLGRDPSATILPLSGPAEIGRAANAFNQMRNRLRAFVDDRTAMVGAISHDLRTPLTRLRFRIEDVPDEQRDGLLKEVTEMEAMISQVITFIRDASTPGARERVDFADLIEGSVEDARLVGANIVIDRNAHIPVEVDPVGIRRLLGNLLENAAKYGENAHVRVSLREGEAIAEIIDSGPGIPEEEFDRVFEPFYRSESARKSGKKGSGLGLAVCRSIARAHGGDVTFENSRDGFIARVKVPAAFAAKPQKAA